MRDVPFGIAVDEIARLFNQAPPFNSCQITEVLGAPFLEGENAITTQNNYSGPLLLTVIGTGQASATSYTDAFYAFTDYLGESISPEHPDYWILAINGELAEVYIPDGQIPAFNSEHVYTFEIDSPGGILTFGVMDDYLIDNSGSYTIAICEDYRESVENSVIDISTQIAALSNFSATPTPSPLPQAMSTPIIRPTTTAAFEAGDPIMLESIHMLSNTQGWGMSGDSILITRDGAWTWHELRLPAAPEKYLDEYGSSVYFEATDADHSWLLYAPKPFTAIHGCVASDASVWYTTDGGQTWNASQPIMHELLDMDCRVTFITMDLREGWMSIDGWCASDGLQRRTQLFRTMDGGKTWEPIKATWCWTEAEDSCFSDTPGWLSEKAIHGQTGWLLDNLSDCGSCSGTVPIPDYFVSMDGGETWNRRHLLPPAGNSDFYAQYSSCETYNLNLLTDEVVRLKLACSQNDPGVKPEAVDYVYASEDAGDTWQIFKLPVSSAELATRLKFFDPDNGLLLGRTIWKTKDGGETWQEINSVTWNGQFSFIDRYHGWAIARSEDEIALVSTVDGGETWEIIHPVILSGE